MYTHTYGYYVCVYIYIYIHIHTPCIARPMSCTILLPQTLDARYDVLDAVSSA